MDPLWHPRPPARYTRGMRTVRCPTCRQETAWEGNRFRPFCTERCKLIDLGAWFEERYRIPGAPLPPESLDDEDDG